MAITTEEIASAFEEIGDILDLQDANPFRIRAYRSAARNIRGYGESLVQQIQDGLNPTEIIGVGTDLALKIQELVQTGSLEYLVELRGEIPDFVLKMRNIQGLGPKRIKAIITDLNITNLDQLEKAAKAGEVASIPGLGKKIEANIVAALSSGSSLVAKRHALQDIKHTVEELVQYIKENKSIHTVTVAGSYRRGKQTVGDIDLLVTADNGEQVIQHFIKSPLVKTILSAGPTRGSVIVRDDLQVDIRVVPEENFGAALQYFTGSMNHNTALRRRAKAKSFKLNEYGVWQGDKCLASRTEEDIYRVLGLQWVPPEWREDQGEIELAAMGKLPKTYEELKKLLKTVR